MNITAQGGFDWCIFGAIKNPIVWKTGLTSDI